MNERFVVCWPDLTRCHCSPERDLGCYIRALWFNQQLRLDPLRKHVGWPLLCASRDEAVGIWLATRVLEDVPESARIPVDIVRRIARSCAVVKGWEIQDIKCTNHMEATARLMRGQQ